MEPRQKISASKLQTDLVALLLSQKLSVSCASGIFRPMVKGNLCGRISKALLLLLAKRGESIREIAGCLKTLRQMEPPRKVQIPNLIDTCGTGGDESHSINISTLAAFVIAGAGGKVAKHGNRSLSSQCGSSDLIEALGIDLEAPPQKMVDSIRRNGIGYFHAPAYHPVFKNIQPLRKALRTKTVFNYLGPLMNPLVLDGQLVGVPTLSDLKLYAEVLRKTKVRRALVCTSLDGMDEISISAPSRIAKIDRGRIRYETWKPAHFGFRKTNKKQLAGGPPRKNRDLALQILTGKLRGPMRDVVIFNSAAGLYAAGIAKNLRQGILRSNQSIDSGRAYAALCGLRKIAGRK